MCIQNCNRHEYVLNSFIWYLNHYYRLITALLQLVELFYWMALIVNFLKPTMKK